MFLILLSVQVYMIIKYPIKSRLLLTKTKVALACIVVWVLALPLGLGAIAYVWIQGMTLLYSYLANFTVLTLIVVIQVVLKVLIVVEILRSPLRDAVNGENLNKKQKDLAKTIVILNIILIVTAFPYCLGRQIHFFYLHLGLDTTMLDQFIHYYQVIFFLNFIANPVVYSLRLHDYRRSLLALFSCKCGKRRNNFQHGARQPMIENAQPLNPCIWHLCHIFSMSNTHDFSI